MLAVRSRTTATFGHIRSRQDLAIAFFSTSAGHPSPNQDYDNVQETFIAAAESAAGKD